MLFYSCQGTEVYRENYQTSKLVFSAEIAIGWKSLTIYAIMFATALLNVLL